MERRGEGRICRLLNCTEIRRKPYKRMKTNVALLCPCLGPCPYASKNESDGRRLENESGSGVEKENDGRSYDDGS